MEARRITEMRSSRFSKEFGFKEAKAKNCDGYLFDCLSSLRKALLK